MSVSQILHMYITYLIYIASNIMNIENQIMLRISNMKALN